MAIDDDSGSIAPPSDAPTEEPAPEPPRRDWRDAASPRAGWTEMDAQARPRPTERVNDKRAVASFVLGLLSFVTCGLTSIPAVGLGLRAREAIDASGGRLRGTALAAAGIATGACGAFTSVVVALAFACGVYLGSRGVVSTRSLTGPAPEPDMATLWEKAAKVPRALGDSASDHRAPIDVTTLDPEAPESFHQQLRAEYDKAASQHRTLVLMTSADRCSVCTEIDESFNDARMQAAFANVHLVRVNINAFARELHDAGMLEETLPWFYKLDSSLRPMDAVSAGEWDDNIPENMAPVLGSFFAGTLRTRRYPSTTLGVSL